MLKGMVNKDLKTGIDLFINFYNIRYALICIHYDSRFNHLIIIHA